MNEAGTSINIQFYREDGASIQATICEPFNLNDPTLADSECFKRVAAVIVQMKEKGWQIVPGGPRKAIQDAVNRDAHSSSNGGGGDTFTATKLTVERDKKDNKIGKLKGGHFLKFGVTLWPEAAAEMGIALNEYAVGDHDIEPIDVRYILNNEGKPQKVVGYA